MTKGQSCVFSSIEQRPKILAFNQLANLNWRRKKVGGHMDRVRSAVQRKKHMPPLVIPSRNRPLSLKLLLEYLSQLYPGQRVVIADGSHPGYATAYEEAVSENAQNLEIDYQRYPADMPLGDRLIDCVSKLDDEIIIVGADDDFPVIDTLKQGAEFLQRNKEYVLAIGGIVTLLRESDRRFRAKLLQARPISNTDPVNRIRKYIRWPFATSYAATRRTHFIDRCKNVDRNGMILFGDYNVAFHDCLAGKIRALPNIGYFTTKLPTHSRLAKPGRLHYLEHAGEVLDLRNYYIEQLTSALGIAEHDAKDVADRMIGMRIAHFTVGAPHRQKGFGHSPLFTEAPVRQQHEAFCDLFSEGTKTRKLLAPNLRLIVDSMNRIFNQNTDNYGEPASYETLDKMIQPESSRQTENWGSDRISREKS